MTDDHDNFGPRPQVFIGSSREGLKVAYALQSTLDDAADVTVWTQSVFPPTEYTLESLLKQLNVADVGVFVFSADDLVRMRGVEYAGVRDNVIFEFGLFVGHLGRKNSVIVAPKNENPRLPSDLLGVNILKYQPDREDGNLVAALGPASAQIRGLLETVESKSTSIPPELRIPLLERRDLLTDQQRDILRTIEDHGPCSRNELAAAFPNIDQRELTYRLEQLRLLMFVSKSTISDDTPNAVYAVSAPYSRACNSGLSRYGSL